MANDSHQTPLKDALQKLETEPITDSAEVGLLADRNGVGAAGRVSTTLPKGFTLTADGRWQHRTGWQLATVVRWSKGK